MFSPKALLVFTSLLVATTEALKGPGSLRQHNRRGTYGQFSAINPTSLVTCEETYLNWTGTKPPYSIGVLVGGGDDAPLYHIGKTNSTHFNWEVDLAANTTVTFAIKGYTGKIAYTDPLVVSAGSDDSCLTTSNWTAARNSSTSKNSTSSATATANTTTINATATAGIGAAPAGTTSTASTTKTGDASRMTAGLGLLIGAAVLTLVV